MISTFDLLWPGDSDSDELHELREAANALIALRRLFEGAYKRAVFSMLADGTEEKLDSLFVEKRVVAHSANLVCSATSDVFKELLNQSEMVKVEVVLAAALANSADRLAGLFRLLEARPANE